SATGNDSFQGCLSDRATFNLIILKPDRSVSLRRIYREGGRWEQKEMPLLDAATVRHTHIRRARTDLTGAIPSQITKYAEFTRQRDIWMYWVYTNWRLPTKLFEQRVRNSTGELDRLQVRVTGPGDSFFEPPSEAKRDPTEDHAWIIRWPVPEGLVGSAV